MDKGYSGIGLIRTKEPANMGGCLRAAHAFGSSMIAVEGSRMRKMYTDTSKAENHIPTLYVDNIFSVIPPKAKVVVVELKEGAECLTSFVHPEQAFYIFGPENSSVPDSICMMADHIVSIPTAFCMNLAATVNVVLYDRKAKQCRK